MKREPKIGELFLSHYTTNTGDRKKFAIAWDSYDPRAIRVAQRMLEEPSAEVGGFTLRKSEPAASFYGAPEAGFDVLIGGVAITSNAVEVDLMTGVWLGTTILEDAAGASRDEMETAADLEQCAALALAMGEHPELAKMIGRRKQ
jgi:hypothetical protein